MHINSIVANINSGKGRIRKIQLIMKRRIKQLILILLIMAQSDSFQVQAKRNKPHICSKFPIGL